MSGTPNNFSIAIVGGGIGGLLAGISLRQRGHNITVVEQKQQYHELTGDGGGMTLSWNAVRCLLRLGIEEDLKQIAEETPYYVEEVDRLVIGHTCWLTTAKLLYPRIQPGMIMDLGTGNGRWVQEVAEIKPDYKVIGIDQYYLDTPSTSNQADFEADDCELDFAERQETVTMVNVRDSFFWIRDHRTLTKRVHEILGQDGWFQNQETRLSEWNSKKPRVCQWRDKALAGARKLGIQLHTATEMRQAHGAGFVEYRDERLTWTIEQLPELREYAISTINATIGMLYDAWGESAELEGVMDGAVQDLEANDCHVEIGVDICRAKKSRR